MNLVRRPHAEAPAAVSPTAGAAASGRSRPRPETPEAAPARILVVYNPAGGRGRRRRLRRAIRRLALEGCAVAVRETLAPGDAEAFARLAAEQGFDAVVAAGGDGTVDEVVNGLAGRGALGLVPLGTVNLLAGELGIARDPERAARTVAAGKRRAIHLGRVGDRQFVMVAGVGFDARVVAGVSLALKRRIGRLAYLVRAAVELARHRPARYRVVVDGRILSAAAVIVANGRRYAGPFVAAPAARLDRPSLEVCLMTRPGRWNVLRYQLALVLGRLARLPDVRTFEARSILVSGPADEPVQADGDIVGRLPIRFGISDRTIDVLVG